MTNFEKWRIYTDGFVSPDNYINFGFYYLVSAALQRRVWLGPDHMPIYPNIYIFLVGEPAVGKGVVIKPVTEILKSHHLTPPDQSKIIPGEDAHVTAALKEEDWRLATNGGKEKDPPLMFPVAADATTWEALVKALSNSLRRINYKKFDPSLGREKSAIYAHSSMCFSLEEISSLFRKKAEEVVNFLLKTYDCGDYEYDTLSRGKDRIKKCCVSLFGGTTPEFMQRVFDDSLLNEGISSRTFFIFATENRKNCFFFPPLTEEQRTYYEEIRKHIGSLGHLYGNVKVDRETEVFLESWAKTHKQNRTNSNPKLNHYYGRKNLHVAKLAMAMHFGESLEMFIKQEVFERAMDVLGEEEKKMHLALGLDKTNPLSGPAKKILTYLEQCGKKTFKQLLAEFWEVLPDGKASLERVIDHLLAMQRIEKVSEQDASGKETSYYKSRVI